MTGAECGAFAEMIQYKQYLLFFGVAGLALGWLAFDRYIDRLERVIKACPACRRKAKLGQDTPSQGPPDQ